MYILVGTSVTSFEDDFFVGIKLKKDLSEVKVQFDFSNICRYVNVARVLVSTLAVSIQDV